MHEVECTNCYKEVVSWQATRRTAREEADWQCCPEEGAACARHSDVDVRLGVELESPGPATEGTATGCEVKP